MDNRFKKFIEIGLSFWTYPAFYFMIVFTVASKTEEFIGNQLMSDNLKLVSFGSFAVFTCELLLDQWWNKKKKVLLITPEKYSKKDPYGEHK